MNLQKAEQAVKNAQNQLDEAMRQLEAAKDPWRHDRPDHCKWLIIKDGGRETIGIVTGPESSRASYFCEFGPLHGSLAVVMDGGWRYANRGEVNISW